MKTQVFVLLVFVLWVFSCKSIKTQAPASSYTPYVYTPQLSTINIPFQVSVKDLENTVNAQISGLLYEDSNLNDDNLMLKIWKHSNISLESVADELRYKVPLKIWIKAGYKVDKFGVSFSDYEETDCALAVKLASKIKINPDWSVTTVTRITGYDWIKEPKLNFGLFNLSLTYIANKIIESEKQRIGALIDEKTSAYLNIKEYVSTAWSRLQEPISLSADPVSWLTIDPVQISMSPLMGRAGILQSSLGLKTFLRFSIGSLPETKQRPLPSLVLGNDETGFFELSFFTDISYSYAEKLVKQYFQGQEYEFDNGKKKIKTEEIELYGNQGRLIIGIKISGSLNGKIFLSGIPYYDEQDKSIKVKDLDFDMDTRNKLLKSADWLAHGVFLKKIQSYLSMPIQKELKQSQDLIEQNISNRKINSYITLDGRLIRIAPETIFLSEAGIGTVVSCKGILNIKVFPH